MTRSLNNGLDKRRKSSHSSQTTPAENSETAIVPFIPPVNPLARISRRIAEQKAVKDSIKSQEIQTNHTNNIETLEPMPPISQPTRKSSANVFKSTSQSKRSTAASIVEQGLNQIPPVSSELETPPERETTPEMPGSSREIQIYSPNMMTPSRPTAICVNKWLDDGGEVVLPFLRQLPMIIPPPAIQSPLPQSLNLALAIIPPPPRGVEEDTVSKRPHSCGRPSVAEKVRINLETQQLRERRRRSQI